MGNETQIFRMEDAPLQIIDGDRGKNYPSRTDQLDEGFCLFLNAGNVTTDGFKFDNKTFITKERDELLRKGKLKRKDIVITTRGTVGNVAFYDNKVPYELLRINSGMVIIRTEENSLDPRYTYYFLKSRLFENQVQMLRTGSAQPQLPIRDINRIKIPIPPLDEQKHIAHNLGTLDDKIELNQRMNQTLEAIARAVFKSWFVDFDPVRAKMAGEPYPLPDEIMSLFPDELVESELGMIPKGWKVEKLENISSITDCLHSKKPNKLSEGKLLLQVYNIGENGELDLSEEYYISHKDYTNWIRRYEASPGDIIISKTGRVGAVAQIPRNFYAAIGRNLVGIRANRDYINEEFLRDLMLSPFMEDEIIQKTSLGTILRSIHVKYIATLRVITPSKEIVDVYSNYLMPIHNSIENNNSQSSILAHQRDVLISEIF